MKKVLKKLLIIIIAVLSLSCSNDEDSNLNVTYEGNLVLQSKNDINIFKEAGYSEVTGNVSIGIAGNLPSTLITNLDGLSNLEKIDGSLFIVNNDALININGLMNLDSIGLKLEIRDNDRLTNVEGLDGLSFVETNIHIQQNIVIQRNIILTDFCALGKLLTEGALNVDFLTKGNAFNPSRQDIVDGNCKL